MRNLAILAAVFLLFSACSNNKKDANAFHYEQNESTSLPISKSDGNASIDTQNPPVPVGE